MRVGLVAEGRGDLAVLVPDVETRVVVNDEFPEGVRARKILLDPSGKTNKPAADEIPFFGHMEEWLLKQYEYRRNTVQSVQGCSSGA